MIELLIRAVNNRTRERNYFKRYCEMLDGCITKGQFDKEIEQNESKYIVSQDQDASSEDIKIALELSPSLLDMPSVDDLADLFSFSEKSIRNNIK